MECSVRNLVSDHLNAARRICNAEAATLYTLSEDARSLNFFLRSRTDTLPHNEVNLYGQDGGPNMFHVCTYSFHTMETVVIDDVYSETRFDLSGTQDFDSKTGYVTTSMIAVPLANHANQSIGVLQLLNVVDPTTGRVGKFGNDERKYLERRAAEFASLLLASK